jgi:hypothetical protein
MSKKLHNGTIITCPAGEPAKLGTGVFCRIEGKVIEGKGPAANTATIEHFCTGCSLKGTGFTICPSWRTARDLDMTQTEASAALQRKQDKQIDLDNESIEEFEARG